MTDEQINQRIAEACGWTGFNPDNIPDCIQYTARRSDGKWGLIPDYLNDLNAMHEAEKMLGQALYCRYIDKLCDQAIKGNNCMYFATAAQRAEAFLRTIKKWEEES